MTLSVPTTVLCPEFTACGQISIADVAVLAKQGYKSIINNRPDGEGGPGQPLSADIEAEAKANGMHYVHFPVPNPMLSAVQVEAYRQACAHLPHPLVAFCRSGGRASAFFQACDGQVGRPA
ncbi:MAG: TIGR01244 family sulfur transferase [Aquabacterium sp.]|nr:TIGR01244 family sulfur transferase [Aquabacterium sp.]